MSKELDSFFEGMSEDEQGQLADASGNASSTGNSDKSEKVIAPGRYVMEMNSFGWVDRDTGELIYFPRLETSAKGALQLISNLEVCDEGTVVVPKGSHQYSYITISPKPGGDSKKLENVMKYMKPQICALSGVEDFKLTKDWIFDVCTADFAVEGDKVVLKRDHKMKNKVYVTIENSEWNGKISLKISNIRAFKPGDKSISDAGIEQANTNFASGTSTSEATSPATSASSEIVEDF